MLGDSACTSVGIARCARCPTPTFRLLLPSMAGHPLGPTALIASLWRWRDLLAQMTERDVRSRYRSSAGGLLWSVANPLVMLAVYTILFSTVFPSKWTTVAAGQADFAMILFIGLLVHGFVAEVMGRAPAIIVGQPNLVKKVVFPLELLPVIAAGSALFHMLVGLAIWMVFYIALNGLPAATALLFPVVILPVLLVSLGAAWLLASLGVYLRDVAHVVPMITTVLLFASPVFYPREAIAEPMRSWLAFNPLSLPIEQLRDVLLWNRAPAADAYLIYLGVAAVVACLGFAWFQATRKGFADVL